MLPQFYYCSGAIGSAHIVTQEEAMYKTRIRGGAGLSVCSVCSMPHCLHLELEVDAACKSMPKLPH